MAQLVKLENYITRYQNHLMHYTHRFIELKMRRWEQLKYEYNWLKEHPHPNSFKSESWNIYEDGKVHPLLAIRTMDELKAYFIQFITHAQMVWASSTLYERSTLSTYYKKDDILKRYLTEWPDTFYLLYDTMVKRKQAAIKLDPVLITPFAIIIIKHIKSEEGSVFQGFNENAWQELTSQGSNKIINPIHGVRRTKEIVREIMKERFVDLPIKNVIAADKSYIEYVEKHHDIDIVDYRSYKEWFLNLKKQNHPLKHQQVQAANALLAHCDTQVG